MVSASLNVGAYEVVTSARLRLVVAVELVCELLADFEVNLLAGLLGQAFQLVDIAVSVILEGEPAVPIELTESPGLVHSSEDTLHERVTKSEGSGCKAVENPSINFFLVFTLLMVNTKRAHQILPNDVWQPLGECHLLQLSAHQPASLLEDQLVQLQRILHLLCQDTGQDLRYSVVLIEHQILNGGERGLGLHSVVPGNKVRGLVTLAALHFQIKLAGGKF